MTTLRTGSATDVGRLRSNNQDSLLVVAANDLYGVADGMGGHQGGEVASAMAVEALRAEPGEATLEDLKTAVRQANRTIFEKAGSDPDLHGMGTTLCAIRVVSGPEGEEIAWVNVGDSRIYLLRDDRLIQLSEDHSLVEDLLRDGQLTEDEAAVHPQRNILTRALGIDLDVDVDGDTVLPFTGDRYLMCSDGLFNEVTEDEIASVLRRLEDPDEAAGELVRLANEGGGRDNTTVVVVDVTDDGGRAAAASAALAEPDATVAIPITSAADPQDGTAGADGPDDIDDPESVFSDRPSSLPESGDDYASSTRDPFGELGRARTRRFTWRVLAFALAVALVAAAVLGAVLWSARNTYFVAFNRDRVALYRGKPGGVLFLDPSLEQTTSIRRNDLPQDVRSRLAEGRTFTSEDKATRYLVTLRSITTTEPPTTTSTAPATTTTTATGATTTTAAGAATTTAAAAPTVAPATAPPASTVP